MTADLWLEFLCLWLLTFLRMGIVGAVAIEIIWLMLDIAKGDGRTRSHLYY